MRGKLLALFLGLALVAPGTAFARGHGGGGHRSSGSYGGGSHSGGHHGATHVRVSTGGHAKGFRLRASGVARDSRGRIKRSESAKNEFKRSHPCPANGRSGGACPGYVIDHVNPLKRGGADAPSNMQWQTKAAAKEKDRWE